MVSIRSFFFIDLLRGLLFNTFAAKLSNFRKNFPIWFSTYQPKRKLLNFLTFHVKLPTFSFFRTALSNYTSQLQVPPSFKIVFLKTIVDFMSPYDGQRYSRFVDSPKLWVPKEHRPRILLNISNIHAFKLKVLTDMNFSPTSFINL